MGERASKRVAEELEQFVLDAHRKQVMEKRDAEAILHPLHRHIMKCADIIDECVEGVEVCKHERTITEDQVLSSPSGEIQAFRLSDCSDAESLELSPRPGLSYDGQDTEPLHPFVACTAE